MEVVLTDHRHRHCGVARVEHLNRGGSRPTTIPLPVTFLPTFESGLTPTAREGGLGYGERTMIRLVLHVLAYSCTLAFVTGVVIAAAKFII